MSSCVTDRVDPVDIASRRVQQAANDIAEVIHETRTVDAALTLRRRVEALIVVLGDVERQALAKATALCP